MEPRLLGPAQWQQVSQVVLDLFLFVALAITATMAFVLDRAILPSLALTAGREVGHVAYRWALGLVFVAAAVLTLYAFGRALLQAVGVIQYLYPRFAI